MSKLIHKIYECVLPQGTCRVTLPSTPMDLFKKCFLWIAPWIAPWIGLWITLWISFLPPNLPEAFALPRPKKNPLAVITDRGAGDHVQVALIASHETLVPGQSFYLGLEFNLEPGWHIYWKNPGDSGVPPKADWKIPPGVTLGEFLWPIPERIAIGHLTNFGYNEHVIFPISAQTSEKIAGKLDGLPIRELSVAVEVEWLVCEVACIPGFASLKLTIPVEKHPATTTVAAKKTPTTRQEGRESRHHRRLAETLRRSNSACPARCRLRRSPVRGDACR